MFNKVSGLIWSVHLERIGYEVLGPSPFEHAPVEDPNLYREPQRRQPRRRVTVTLCYGLSIKPNQPSGFVRKCETLQDSFASCRAHLAAKLRSLQQHSEGFT